MHPSVPTKVQAPATEKPSPPQPRSLSLARAFTQLLDALIASVARLAASLKFKGSAFVDAKPVISYADTNITEKYPTTATTANLMESMGADTTMTPAGSAGAITGTKRKTVVVLGCAYGGARAAQILAADLPAGWRLVVLDRNSHANHVYVMPRFAVLPGHEYKAFIPYTNVFLQNQEKEEQPEEEERERFTVLHAQITALQANTVTYKSLSPNREDSDKEETLVFDYAIYALGAHMPPPLDLWGSASFPATSPSFYPSPSGDDKEKGVTKYHGLKTEGCAFFVAKQAEIARVAAAEGGGSVLVVGGGALGIQFATDIKAVYPSTAVTLLHSRERLLPRFGEGMHDEVLRSCDALGVKVILGERLDLGSLSTNKEVATQEGEARTQRVVRTVTGREIVADLVLMCTGQTPNTTLLAGLDDALVEPRSRHARVHRTMQVAGRTMYEEDQQAPSAALTSAVAEHAKGGAEVKDAVEALASLALTESAKNRDAKDTPYPHIFAIGDAAAAFGAIPAGHNAYAQGEVAARNVFRLIDRAEVGAKKGSDGEEEPLEEYTPGPPAIKVSLGLERAVYQVGPNIGVKTDGVPDLQAAAIWPYFGIKVEKDEDMRA